MAFEGLSEKISLVFKKLKSKGKLSEQDVKIAMREVRMALLEADVNYKVAKDFTNSVIERAVGEKILESLTPAQMVIKIVNEELTKLMGSKQVRANIYQHQPAVLMLCGLQGSGKTTHAAKLAAMQKKKGHRPLLVACDVYRPAAIEQLKVVGAQANVPVFEMGNENPVKIVKQALGFAKDHGHDILIIDTAGRLHIDEKLMKELKDIKEAVTPDDILLVVDSMTGQDAVNVAKSFNDLLDITGVILTKLDGDTRGGAALSIRAVTGKPIKFVGTGEKLENIEEFYPERMASRILGMGDMLTLIEEAGNKIDMKKAEKMVNKLAKNKFDYNDLLEQFSQVKKLGSIKSLLSKIPGVSKKIQGVDIDDRQMDRVCAIMLSMTAQERSNPKLMNPSRKRRIAAGSGMKVEDVNRLIRQFEQMQKMMKQLNGKKGKKRFGFPPGMEMGGMNNIMPPHLM